MQKNNTGIIWAPTAIEDLIQIKEYLIATTPQERVEKVVLRVHTIAESLPALPLLWRPRDNLSPGLRFAPAHPYFVCYRVLEHHIEIVRVVHEKRDIATVFSLQTQQL